MDGAQAQIDKLRARDAADAAALAANKAKNPADRQAALKNESNLRQEVAEAKPVPPAKGITAPLPGGGTVDMNGPQISPLGQLILRSRSRPRPSPR